MGNPEDEGESEASHSVTMVDLKKLETSLSSTLGNEIQQLRQLVEQLVRDKQTSPPPSLEETPPNPKANAPAKPLEEVAGVNIIPPTPPPKRVMGRKSTMRFPDGTLPTLLSLIHI